VEFEWDIDKAEENLRRHGIRFAEAMTVFGYTLEVTIPDPDHSEGEFRFFSLGRSEADRYSSPPIPNAIPASDHQRTRGDSQGKTRL
jgi:uncharacterized DUF497 family protein